MLECERGQTTIVQTFKHLQHCYFFGSIINEHPLRCMFLFLRYFSSFPPFSPASRARVIFYVRKLLFRVLFLSGEFSRCCLLSSTAEKRQNQWKNRQRKIFPKRFLRISKASHFDDNRTKIVKKGASVKGFPRVKSLNFPFFQWL